MKAAELRQKSIEELKEQLKKLHKDVHDSLLEVLKRKEKNVKKPRLLRKDIARVRSIILEKQVLSEEKHE